MENQRLVDLIKARASDQSIRDIVSNIKVKTDKGEGFIAGIIYLIMFKDLNSLCRRIYNQI